MRDLTTFLSFQTNSDYQLPIMSSVAYSNITQLPTVSQNSHVNLGHLVLLIFEATMEVVCVSLPGYILARQGIFSAEHQKFLANLNVVLFTPCLIFTKLASKLTAEKLIDLAIIPLVFVVQTAVSYIVSIAVSKCFRFEKKPTNFVIAMGIFGNSNSLPISLVISLSQTLKGLHWSKIPYDNDEEVAARGILYLLIFQQLGQLVRWSWGYYVLLAPDKIIDTERGNNIENYTETPPLIPGLTNNSTYLPGNEACGSSDTASLRSDNKSISARSIYTGFVDPDDKSPIPKNYQEFINGGSPNHIYVRGSINSFPGIRSQSISDDRDIPSGINGFKFRLLSHVSRLICFIKQKIISCVCCIYTFFPSSIQRKFYQISAFVKRFLAGIWEFMNPPLWAMLSAIIVASIPKLQHVFFTKGTFISNSFTRAVTQSGGVAVPLILVVLGANLARNTLPKESLDENSEENKIGKKLLIASLLSRMVFPALFMAPFLALIAKYIPISIVDDPIFVIVCFLLTGAPSAIQLAQICQINGVYEGVMSKLLFHSYVIWVFPSTLALVTCALEVVRWANISK
ncbi:putative auxin efflux carrier superfamily [Erysiphe neolycopersici]|uniref:Putative auxin efflux carrier superfamily n=1 Tax=Erysiphe neolycopersici TaxID=212602 RepID=A0A420HZ15_9PEZI|nr:putative auxin efflux carrier superfamily [Erysiphe neolycopersici]